MTTTMTKKVSKFETLVTEVNSILSQYSGRLSLRQVYYRLVSKHVIPNNINEYKGLSRHLVKARELGLVSWRRIEDRNRGTQGGDYGASFDYEPDYENFIRERLGEAMSRAYHTIAKWDRQPKRVEVWIEKDALSALAHGVARRYNVTVCPSKGYSSFTYIMEAVNRINRYDKPCTILYFGDYDPSGMDITRDLEERLVRYGCNNLNAVERICLSIEQIEEHNLPPFPAKKSDARYEKFVEETGSDDAVELDALEPPILEAYIKEAIENKIDFEIWEENKTREDEIEELLNKEVEKLREAIKEAFPWMDENDD